MKDTVAKKDWNSEPIRGFYEWAEIHHYSEKTRLTYFSMFNCFIEFLDKSKIELKDISKSLFTQFLKNRGVNEKTKNMYIFLVSDILSDMVDHGEIDENPLEGLLQNRRKLNRAKNPKRLPLSLSESEVVMITEVVEKLPVNYQNIRIKCAVLILLGCGLRNEELCSLKDKEVHLYDENPWMTVIGKFNKERIVPIPDSIIPTLELFREMRENERKSEYFLPSMKNGNPYSNSGVYRLVKRVLIEAGVFKRRMSPHILRHTFATRNLAKGIDIKIVQSWLGHESLASTAIYDHVEIAKNAAKPVN